MNTIRHRLATWKGLLAWLMLVLILALYPYTGLSGSTLFTFSQVFILVTLASNWNLIGGMTGYVDFGHAVFFGIGAYVMGILVTPVDMAFSPHLSFWQALPIAGLAAAAFADYYFTLTLMAVASTPRCTKSAPLSSLPSSLAS